jgi:hypothetical protein
LIEAIVDSIATVRLFSAGYPPPSKLGQSGSWRERKAKDVARKMFVATPSFLRHAGLRKEARPGMMARACRTHPSRDMPMAGDPNESKP